MLSEELPTDYGGCVSVLHVARKAARGDHVGLQIAGGADVQHSIADWGGRTAIELTNLQVSQ